MQTILLFDDWLLDGHRGLVRDWQQPEPLGMPCSDPFSPRGCGYASVQYDQPSGQWRAWYILRPPGPPRPFREGVAGPLVLAMVVSEDGLNWRPFQGSLKSGSGSSPWPHVVFSGFVDGCGQVFEDPLESDLQRRYKMAPVVWTGRGEEGQAHHNEVRLATSPDGISWKLEESIYPLHSDTYHSFTCNPSTGRYQMAMRPSCADRRVAIIQSEDMRNWSEPLLILSPDPGDPPCVQFYGMPHYRYEGYYLGLLWLFHTQYEEPSPVKRAGLIDTHLAYSLNGVAWNRTIRRPLLPLTTPGEFGGGCVYGCSLVEAPEGELRIYAVATKGEHHDPDQRSALAAYQLRKDGFVCLRPEGKYGELITRAIVPESEPLTINGRAPQGQITIEVLDGSERPLPDFSGENAARFRGNETDWPVRWPRASFGQLSGQRIKLRLRLDLAELFAIRFQGLFAYGHTSFRNLDSLGFDRPE